jgi:hypothetical protein
MRFRLRTLLIVLAVTPVALWFAWVPPLPLRVSPPPKSWNYAEINEGLPLRWEKGTVHVLAWEVLADDRPHEYTQALILKRFDQATADGGHCWLLAHLYFDLKDSPRPWQGPTRIPSPLLSGERMPALTDAQLFGHTFYIDRPTDNQIEAFLSETDWTPTLGKDGFVFVDDRVRDVTTRLADGGVNRKAWRSVLGRDVPVRLFPELRTSMTAKQ